MSEHHDGVSRRHALRLVLGQGAEIARERDARALEDEQRTALEGALGAVATGPVERLGPEHADEIVDVFADAFRGYPVMAYVLGDDGSEARLRALVRLFVMARVLRGEPLLGVRRGAALIAAATASFPGDAPAPAEFLALRGELWRELGADAQARYEAFGATASTFPADFPHVHLNMVGVRPTEQRRGSARRLIDEVQAISRARPGSEGVTLTTEHPANLAFYLQLGFGPSGHATVAPDLETWGFFRRD